MCIFGVFELQDEKLVRYQCCRQTHPISSEHLTYETVWLQVKSSAIWNLKRSMKIHHHLMGPAVVNGSKRMTLGLRTTSLSVATVDIRTKTLNYSHALGLGNVNPELQWYMHTSRSRHTIHKLWRYYILIKNYNKTVHVGNYTTGS